MRSKCCFGTSICFNEIQIYWQCPYALRMGFLLCRKMRRKIHPLLPDGAAVDERAQAQEVKEAGHPPGKVS